MAEEQEEQKEKSSKLLIILVIILLLLLGIAGSLGVWWWQQEEAKKQKSASDKQIQELQQQINELKSSDTDEEADETGFIEGSLTYPSEVIPDDLVVYAENIDTGEIYETADRLSGDAYAISHIGYKVEVPEGKYYVYGKLTSDPTKKAYYNKYITCGMSVECTDTSKIVVTVNAGETTDNIIVGDWWNL